MEEETHAVLAWWDGVTRPPFTLSNWVVGGAAGNAVFRSRRNGAKLIIKQPTLVSLIIPLVTWCTLRRSHGQKRTGVGD